MLPVARQAGSVTAVGVIGRIEHREAMELTAVENQRFLDLLRTLGPQDWSRPTDCSRWDVRAVVAHVVGSACAQASVREFVHQLRTGLPLTRQIDSNTTADFYNPRELDGFHNQSQCGYGFGVGRDGQAKGGIGLSPRGFPRTLCRACAGINQRATDL
ncbi:MAG: maleylpyruvate isomerase N-terminal domain-containing protein [Candidatus Dormiibacterota bacterium]